MSECREGKENTNYEEIAQACAMIRPDLVFVLGTPCVRDADTSLLDTDNAHVEFADPVSPDIGSPQRALTSTPTAGPFYLAN
jgi:hypothetical protein